MIFNSVTFLLFLAVVVVLYWKLPRRPRLWMLFLASLCFYGFWRWEFLPLMLFSAGTDYLVSLRLGVTRNRTRRRMLLGVSLLVNLGLLFVFKYLIFLAVNVQATFQWLGVEFEIPAWLGNIVLPLGISFYTFQTISYSVDVYRRFVKPQTDFILYGTYVIFFPQLVAGPILRAREVISQLDVRPRFDLADLATGLRRILCGLFLKTVLADNIAPLVNVGFAAEAHLLSAWDVWTLAFLFGLQIYFDFSAYSHIAIGSARLMGIHFPENFDFPYVATSPREFWKRWHISLSSWIRDYLYLPLAGARVHDRSTGGLSIDRERRLQTGRLHWTRALFLTWAIMGLWHGAAWTFVLWGLYHGCFVYGHRLLAGLVQNWPQRIRAGLGWCLTLPLAMLSWVFFRAEGTTQLDRLGQAFTMVAKVANPAQYLALGLRENTYLVTFLLMLGVVATWLVRTRLLPRLRPAGPAVLVLDTLACTAMAAAVFIFLRPVVQFIYFQF